MSFFTSRAASPFRFYDKRTGGAAVGEPLDVPGIKPGDVLLAVMACSGARVPGSDPSAFTISDDAIQSATADTAECRVHVVWARRRSDDKRNSERAVAFTSHRAGR